MSTKECIVCSPPSFDEVIARVQNRTLYICEQHQKTQDSQIVYLGCGKKYGDPFTFGINAMSVPQVASLKDRSGVILLMSHHCYFCRHGKEYDSLPENELLFVAIGNPFAIFGEECAAVSEVH